ncbi:MAG TPA: cysteine hydrolase [Stellaceae bacterium]|jgi:nicotinamidase-related amidase|nr:cysteine hydrolase [Stellaceae bacterium]
MSLASRFLSLALVGGTLALSLPAHAADIVDSWAQAQAPAAPKLEDVTVDPKTTALLMLDFLKQNCAPNPTCMNTLPAMQELLKRARDKKMLVIYTKFPSAAPNVPAPTAADVLPPVAPLGKEPMITAFLDKFLKTNLDQVLKKNHIKTVIAVGSAGNGAVLFTAASAYFHGYDVVVPVDGVSSRAPYSDQAAVNTLAAGPVMGGKIKLTRSTMLKF